MRQYFSQKQPIAAFIGQFGGQALDPINYVPVFCQGAQLAAVARFGSIGGRALMSASEAAINTAAFGILTAGVRAKLGDDVSFEMTNRVVASPGGVIVGGPDPDLIRVESLQTGHCSLCPRGWLA